MKIYFITKNAHKVIEAAEAIRGFNIDLAEAPEGVEKEEVQSDSIEEISLRAAKEAMKIFNEPFVVEDDGLFMDAYGGFPGPYTAYAYRTIGLRGVIALARAAGDYRASFRSALTLHVNGRLYLFTRSVKGRISDQPRGAQGFGFDPVFVPEGMTRTFAEMTAEEKSELSHRALAFRQMAAYLKTAGMI